MASEKSEDVAREDLEYYTDRLWSGDLEEVREFLLGRGLEPSEFLMAGYLESDECEGIGLLVDTNGRVHLIRSEQVPEVTPQKMRVVSIEDVTDDPDMYYGFDDVVEAAREPIAQKNGKVDRLGRLLERRDNE